MVDFAPQFTQLLYLDTEWYAPVDDRAKALGSLIVNPAREGHRFLGGVFVREFPLLQGRLPIEEHWSFLPGEEDNALREVYRLFQRAWAELAGRSRDHPDLVVVGIGVARFDLPALFTRSLVRGIDRPEKLFEIFFNTKIVDLADLGIGRDNARDPILYPRTANQLRQGRLAGRRKPSGKRVWQLLEERRYEEIRTRTRSEVEEVIEIARLFLGSPSSSTNPFPR